MNTCFYTVTGYPGTRSKFLGGLACIAFVFCSTISLSFAGLQHGAPSGSRGSFAGPGRRIGPNPPPASVAAHNPYLNAYRGAPTGNPGYRGPIVTPNRDMVGSRNGFVSNPANQISATRRQEAVPQTRDLNPTTAMQPFGASVQGPQRESAEINAQRSDNRSQHLSANPLAYGARANINEKFDRYENRSVSGPRISEDRRERLNRARDFLINLIGIGYAPLLVDSWCDDLFDDQIDDGMPMDLVDAYWGQPVDTQEFVQYYVPYELCTYRTVDGDYHQVTYRNRVVSRPTSNVADVRTQ
jgi:hypothetical protein